MNVVRPAAVAGTFYPAGQADLQASVSGLLAGAATTVTGRAPKALIAPHAGYVYSGSTAAAAYARLATVRDIVRRVVLLGPAHRVAFNGLALPGADTFASPLGPVRIDAQAIAMLADLPQVTTNAEAHAHEHSLEVHLPFLQQTLGDFSLVPLVVGRASPEQVAEVIERLWGGPETLVVVSSDLSHYLPYRTATITDAQTVRDMLALDPVIDHEHACGATPVNGLLRVARRRGLAPELLAVCNSGDTAGDRNRVVGYASIGLFEDAPVSETKTTVDRGTTLLAIARATIGRQLGMNLTAREDASFLREPGATFVTINKAGQLRGCIGSLAAHRPLLDDVKHNARAAAFLDPRFGPVSLREFDQIQVEVSLLAAAQPMSFTDEADAMGQLRPGVDGVILEHSGHRSTFLPQVWESLPTPVEFLSHLKQKAGLPATFWAPDMKLSRYTVDKWSETT